MSPQRRFRGFYPDLKTNIIRFATGGVFLIGVLLLFVTYGLERGSVPFSVSAGVAASLLATSVYAFFTVVQSSFVKNILDQGVRSVFTDRADDFTDQDWDDLLSHIHDYYKVLGVANYGYVRSEPQRQRTRQGLQTALQRGATVELIWLDPDCPAMKVRDNEEPRGTRAQAIESIKWFWKERQDLPEDTRPRLVLKTHSSSPTCGFTWADDQMIVSHYLARALNLNAPGFVLNAFQHEDPEKKIRLRKRKLTLMATAYKENYMEVSAQASEIDFAFVQGLNANG